MKCAKSEKLPYGNYRCRFCNCSFWPQDGAPHCFAQDKEPEAGTLPDFYPATTLPVYRSYADFKRQRGETVSAAFNGDAVDAVWKLRHY